MAFTPITNLRGPAARISEATADLVPWDQGVSVDMTGLDQDRKFHFDIPLPLPTPETVNNDVATAALVLNPTATQGAVVETIGLRTRPRPLALPAGFDWQDAPIRLLWDGRAVATDFDVRTFKHTGGTTYYVDSVNGLGSNDGLTEGTAVQTTTAAFALASPGDEVVLLDEKVLWRAFFGNSTAAPMVAGVNVIARHPGLAMPQADLLTYTKTAGRTNVYQAARSNVMDVIDVADSREGVGFVNAASLTECDATPGSWWSDGTLLHVHALDSGAPDPMTVFALLNVPGFTIRSATNPVAVYMEGINFYGGSRNLLLDGGAGGDLDFYGYRVGMFHATGPTAGRSDNLVAGGAHRVFLQECAAKYSNKDGANYSLYDLSDTARLAPQVIEVDCDMGHNGLGQSGDLSCNASTGHGGAKIIRVGGTYQDTMGGVVCDVHAGTQSVNAGIHVQDSRTGLNEIRGSLISAGQGAESWVFGGDAYRGGTVDVWADPGSAVRGAGVWNYTSGGTGILELDLVA